MEKKEKEEGRCANPRWWNILTQNTKTFLSKHILLSISAVLLELSLNVSHSHKVPNFYKYTFVIQRAPLYKCIFEPQCAPLLQMCPTFTNVYLCSNVPTLKMCSTFTKAYLRPNVPHFTNTPHLYKCIFVFQCTTLFPTLQIYTIFINVYLYPSYPIYAN